MQSNRKMCDMCRSSDLVFMARQPYLLPGTKTSSFHDVVACLQCGFVFAQKTGNWETLVTYYRRANKYANSSTKSAIPGSITGYHRDSFRFIDRELQSLKKDRHSLKLVDVGCATGQFLHLFDSAGYRRVLGIDPSSTSRVLARSWWNLDVKVGELETFQTHSPFDFVMSYSVFEHLEKLDRVVDAIKKLLVPGGILFLSVPNLIRFGHPLIEPFMELSTEHINFFTIGSFKNLLGPAGFELHATYSHATDAYGTIALDSLWVYTGKEQKITFDTKGIPAMQTYLSQSMKRLRMLEKSLSSLCLGKEFAVWGTGSLTARLLPTTILSKAPISFFIDKNPANQKQKLLGKPVMAPDYLLTHHIPVLVASYLSSESIVHELQTTYSYPARDIMTI